MIHSPNIVIKKIFQFLKENIFINFFGDLLTNYYIFIDLKEILTKENG